jgi:hypothetical protein
MNSFQRREQTEQLCCTYFLFVFEQISLNRIRRKKISDLVLTTVCLQ